MDQENQHLFELQIDQQSISNLSEGARWAKFIAVIGFIFCGLMVIVAFFIGTIMTYVMSTAMAGSGFPAISGGIFTFVYLFFAVLWFIPCLFLFRFGSQMQAAVKENQQEKLNLSFRNLKSYFKFIGILFIVVMSLYALGIVGAIIAGIAMR